MAMLTAKSVPEFFRVSTETDSMGSEDDNMIPKVDLSRMRATVFGEQATGQIFLDTPGSNGFSKNGQNGRPHANGPANTNGSHASGQPKSNGGDQAHGNGHLNGKDHTKGNGQSHDDTGKSRPLLSALDLNGSNTLPKISDEAEPCQLDGAAGKEKNMADSLDPLVRRPSAAQRMLKAARMAKAQIFSKQIPKEDVAAHDSKSHTIVGRVTEDVVRNLRRVHHLGRSKTVPSHRKGAKAGPSTVLKRARSHPDIRQFGPPSSEETSVNPQNFSKSASILPFNGFFGPLGVNAAIKAAIDEPMDPNKDYVVENGRTYHAYKKEKQYFMPNDDNEIFAQERFHDWLTNTVQHGSLYQARLSRNVKQILDLGTGGGQWAIEMAQKYPGATVHGIDLSPIWDTPELPNVHFSVADIEDEWPFPKDHFDMIYARYLSGGISDWDLLVQKAYEHLKPGGYLEILDPSWQVYADDDSVDPEGDLSNWNMQFIKYMAQTGRSVTAAENHRQRLKATGFAIEKAEPCKLLTGTWGETAFCQQSGEEHLELMLMALPNMSMRVFTKVGGMKPETCVDIVRRACRDLRSDDIHSYFVLHSLVGRKPTGSTPEIVSPEYNSPVIKPQPEPDYVKVDPPKYKTMKLRGGQEKGPHISITSGPFPEAENGRQSGLGKIFKRWSVGRKSGKNLKKAKDEYDSDSDLY